MENPAANIEPRLISHLIRLLVAINLVASVMGEGICGGAMGGRM